MLRAGSIPILSDNYAWILSQPSSSTVVVVDPGEPHAVTEWLSKHGLRASTILVTHRHHDHIGGIDDLVARFSSRVVAPRRDAVPAMTLAVDDGDTVVDEEAGVEFTVIAVPGHTAGHVAYAGHGAVLTGDALFAGGCGRVFEGTLAEMYASLQRLAALPAETLVYCAHEYTLANLKFALEVESSNIDLQKRFESVQVEREFGGVTLPTTIGLELETNPFLRCQVPAVVQAAEQHAGRSVEPGAATFEVIRRWKDGWRG